VLRKHCGRIQSVSNGEDYFCDTVRKIFSDATKDNSKLNKPSAGLTSILTEREIEVTTLIAEFSLEKRLANNLFISNNTVETHRKKHNEEITSKKTLSVWSICS
jgi:DNA-binding NarL/FixJ family response regulator